MTQQDGTGREVPYRSNSDAREPATSRPPAPAPVDASMQEIRSTGACIETLSLIFDPHWYLWKYRDVENAGLDPVQHYFGQGHQEGRDPNRFFSTKWYLANNPDVIATGGNPFLHYILYGAREGRKPRPGS